MDKFKKIRDWCDKNKGKTILIIIVVLVVLGEISKSPDSNQNMEQNNNTNTNVPQPIAVVEKTQPSSAGSDAQAKEIQKLKDQIQQMKDQNSNKTETPSPVVNAAPTVIQTPIVTQPQNTAPKSWHNVTTFSGNGGKTTGSFIIQGSQWRANWQVNHAGYFGANAESTNGDDTCSIANAIGPASDTSYCYKSGEFHLWVNTGYAWTITVEDYY